MIDCLPQSHSQETTIINVLLYHDKFVLRQQKIPGVFK